MTLPNRGKLHHEKPLYEPESRRPIALAFRKTAAGPVRFCLNWNIHPDTISYFSILSAIIAAICLWKSGDLPWLLLIGPVFIYIRLWLNMLDGMVALATGQASRRGEILNELPDRISDVLIFIGAAHSGLCNVLGGYWAAIMALLTAYVGTLGQAVGFHREFSGIMSKPWRMVTLHIGSWTTLCFIWWRDGDIHLSNLTVMDWTHLFVIAGCVQTITIRLSRLFSASEKNSEV